MFKRHLATAALAVSALGVLAVGGASSGQDPQTLATAPPPSNSPATGKLQMGTNLDGLAYWSPALPVLDLMKASGQWLPQTEGTYDTGEPIALDARGWVRQLPAAGDARRYDSVLVNVLHDNPAAPSGATYVVLYDGTGTVTVLDLGGTQTIAQSPGRLTVKTGEGGGIYLRVAATDPKQDGDYIRNIRVVRQDLLPLYEAGQSFNPAYVEKLRGFRVLRFMDWMNTNVLFDKTGMAISGDAAIDRAPMLDWADRPRPDNRCWGDQCRGVPVEAMVELANRVGAEPWFNMPANASDDYMRHFAGYVRDHLRPDLRVHVEYSNEVWNWMFPQARFAQTRARAAFGPDANWLEYYGVRAAQMGRIWKNTFGERALRSGKPGRTSVVFNTQFGWKGLEANGLDTVNWKDAKGARLRASDYFDEYAITGYYDGTMNTAETAPIVKGWWRDADGGYGRAIAALRDRILTFNAPIYAYHAEQAHARGLRLVTYESGFGEYTPISEHTNQTYTDFLAKLQRRPEFYDLENANYAAFRNAGGTLYMNFGIISTPGKWGNWSALESVNQATSPRYRALRDQSAMADAKPRVPAASMQ